MEIEKELSVLATIKISKIGKNEGKEVKKLILYNEYNEEIEDISRYLPLRILDKILSNNDETD